MKITIIRSEPTKETLTHMYDVFNRILKDKPECFYTKEEVEELKKDPENTWL